jgi:transposase-like protein
MHSTDARGYPTERPGPPSSTDHVPVLCPMCQSSSTVTAAKNPDESSYWRCRDCGEIWNVGRSCRMTGGGAS